MVALSPNLWLKFNAVDTVVFVVPLAFFECDKEVSHEVLLVAVLFRSSIANMASRFPPLSSESDLRVLKPITGSLWPLYP